MKDSDLLCPECDGDGEYPCETCGCVNECDYCEGTGYDPEKVDVDAYKAAEQPWVSIPDVSQFLREE